MIINITLNMDEQLADRQVPGVYPGWSVGIPLRPAPFFSSACFLALRRSRTFL
jgi:hypothetical protein